MGEYKNYLPMHLRCLSKYERRFVFEYIKDYNGMKAAIRAGAPERGAAYRAHSLRHRPNVKKAIEIEDRAIRNRALISKERVLRELAAIGFSKMTDFAKWGPKGLTLVESDILDGMSDAAVNEVSCDIRFLPGRDGEEDGGIVERTRIKTHDKVKALCEIMKYLEKSDKQNPYSASKVIDFCFDDDAPGDGEEDEDKDD